MNILARYSYNIITLLFYFQVKKQTGRYSYNNTRLTPMIEFMFNYNKFLLSDILLFD